MAINELSEIFWHGVNDTVSMGEYGKESGENGGVQRIWESMDVEGIGEFLVVYGVGSSMEEIWKEWGDMGEEWNGEVCGREGSVGDVGKYGGGVEECMG